MANKIIGDPNVAEKEGFEWVDHDLAMLVINQCKMYIEGIVKDEGIWTLDEKKIFEENATNFHAFEWQWTISDINEEVNKYLTRNLFYKSMAVDGEKHDDGQEG